MASLEENKKLAEDLLKSVNEAAGSARTLFVTLMVLTIYVFIVVAGTDDLSLLRNSTVAVPTLSNATLPARAFFLVIAGVYVFLHLDLLIHFKLLSDKLRRFNEVLEDGLQDETMARDFRVRLAGFPFANWLGSDPRGGWVAHALQGVMVWLTLVFVPLLLLLDVQLGFLAYQSELITWLHRSAILADVLLLSYFWPVLAGGRFRVPAATGGWRALKSAARPEWLLVGQGLRQVWSVSQRFAVEFTQSALLGLAIVLIVGLPMYALPLLWLWFCTGLGHGLRRLIGGLRRLIGGLWRWVKPWFQLLVGLLVLALTLAGRFMLSLPRARMAVLLPGLFALVVSLLVATIPEERADYWGRAVFGELDHEELGKQFGELIRAECRRGEREKGGDFICIFDEVIDAEDQELVTNAAPPATIEEETTGRFHFNCAELVAHWPGLPGKGSVEPAPGSVDRAAGKGQDQSALANYLQNANHLPRHMRASCPTVVLFHLKDGVFRRTLSVTNQVVAKNDIKPELVADVRASLRRAANGKPDAEEEYQKALDQITGLDLTERSLRWADLSGTSLPGALLVRTHLEYARLEKVDWRRINGSEARLESASLFGATLTGTNLGRATLTGADLRWAKLTGVDLGKATLTGADLDVATLIGANLFDAKLTGANLPLAELTGADLHWAKLTGANLDGTWLIGADLRYAKLTGANLPNATLTGADLRDTTLIGAGLFEAKLTGANLEGATLTAGQFVGTDFRGAVGPQSGGKSHQIWLSLPQHLLEIPDPAILKQVTAELAQVRTAAAEAALERLQVQAGKPASGFDFSDCVGDESCHAPAAQQQKTAVNRAKTLAGLICPKSGKAEPALVKRLTEDLREEASAGGKDAPPWQNWIAQAAQAALKDLENRHCLPPKNP